MIFMSYLSVNRSAPGGAPGRRSGAPGGAPGRGSVARLIGITFEDESAIGSSEAKGVGQRAVDAHGARLVGHVVQIAVGVWSFVVDGGRGHLIADGEDGDAGLQASGAAQQMSS